MRQNFIFSAPEALLCLKFCCQKKYNNEFGDSLKSKGFHNFKTYEFLGSIHHPFKMTMELMKQFKKTEENHAE